MKAQTSKPVVLHDGEGDATWFIGTLMTRKAGATDGVGGVAFLDQLAPAGFGPPLHVHRREDEGFYILEGEVDFVCDGRSEEHTSELQSQSNLVCRLLLETK